MHMTFLCHALKNIAELGKMYKVHANIIKILISVSAKYVSVNPACNLVQLN
jgi:hypothetical protein